MKHSINQSFKSIFIILFTLFVGVSVMQGQDLKAYFASLKAQSSPASSGSGQVKLTWLDITGRPMGVPLATQLNSYALGNSANFSGFGETAQLIGATLCAMDGVESTSQMGDQIYMTSYVYFHADAEPADGSYLAGWTFTDPAISRIDTAMGPKAYNPVWTEVEPDVWQDVYIYDEENSGPFYSPCFKVLPDKNNYAVYAESGAEALALMETAKEIANNSEKVNNIYAVFNKYLLSNPQTTSASLDAAIGNTAQINVSVDVEGDISQFKENYADFVFPTNPTSVCQAYGISESPFAVDESGYWTWDLAETPMEVLSPTKIRAYVVITYTAKENITVGTHNATLTVKMAGENASELNIPLSVNALDPKRPEALLFDGNTQKETSITKLKDLLNVDISSYTNPILQLNKPVEDNLTFSGKNFTLDLNGNTAQSTTVSSGNVTFAYSKYSGSITSLTVNGGKAILNGGTFGVLTIGAGGEVEQNGATITGAAINNGTLTTNEGEFDGGLTSSKTLIINNGTFKGETALTISGGTAALNRGNIEGDVCGLKVTNGTVTVKKLAAIKGETNSVLQEGGTVNIECGKFKGLLSAVSSFTSGYFTDKAHAQNVETGKDWMQLTDGVEYNEGYRYFLGTAESAQTNGVGVCRIGTVSYAKLEDALAYANNNPSVENIVIFMTNDYVLPAGYYTLPANATIVVPMSDTQAKEINKTAPRVVYNDVRTNTPYEIPTEFRRLTFASGVNIDVFGEIELTCSQLASNEAYTSQPTGPYGHLVMEEGSHMTLQANSELRAWGFITGKGETDARRDSKVREIFQLGDWKGAFTSVKIVGMFPMIGDDSDKKIFPVTQYFIQNIESPVKYHPGAILSTSAAVSEGLSNELSVSMAATDIKIVGVNGRDSAIFVMDNNADAENTWVRKWYDEENDVQVYDINNAAHIGQMVLDMGELNVPLGKKVYSVNVRLNSGKFDLPITSNMKIHLLSGSMDFQQNTCLLPGAEVEVDKESIVSIAQDKDDPEHTGALYVYDADDWNSYAYGTQNGESYSTNTKTVRYAPSWDGLICQGKSINESERGKPTKRDESTKVDAKINVHGTFTTATGFVYTSVGNGANGVYNPEGTPTGGANIFSTNEDAGTFIFNENAFEAENPRDVYQVHVSGSVNPLGRNTSYDKIPFYPARLKNGNEKYVNTDEAKAGDAYCYINNEWTTMYPDEDNPCFMVDHNVETGDVYYAKPAEYVAVVAKKELNTKDPKNTYMEFIGNADHTYSDADGAGRLFILISDPDCQWWEVEKKDNLYHCIHPNNDTYYYWDEDEYKWKEKRFTITWKNWDGTEIRFTDPEDDEETIRYEVPYGTMAEFLGTNPTREATADYTYDFTGWTPELGPVTKDVTYMATYEQKQRMYTITFLNEGGSLIETQFLPLGASPVCENTPTKVGHILQWNPSVAPVSGEATYTAAWLETPPTEFTIIFKNYDNSELCTVKNVQFGESPEYPLTDNPTKVDPKSEYDFNFVGWKGLDGNVYAPNALPEATENATYVAEFTPSIKRFNICFYDENGNKLGETQNLPYGENPVAPNYTIEEPGYTIVTLWKNKKDVEDDIDIPRTIETVYEDADYIADVTTLRTKNKYTITIKSNPSGACTFTGAGTFDYNTTVKNVTVSYDEEQYEFQGWSDLTGDAKKATTHADFILTEDITIVADFRYKGDDKVTITWKNWNGSDLGTSEPKVNAATTYTGATPTKPADTQYTYTFDGWNAGSASGKYYKNNMTPKATTNAVYYAHFSATTIPDLNVTSVTTLTAPVTFKNLVITSNGTSSGQLINPDYLTITGNAYFDLTLNANAETWYAFAVPWKVDATSGVSVLDDGAKLELDRTYHVLYYDGANRAARGKAQRSWKFLADKADKTLEPGVFYLIYLNNSANTLRFTKKAGASINTDSVKVQQYQSQTGNPADANWNGIANPAVYHAYMNAGVEYGQPYESELIEMSSHEFIVGEPIFVQVPAEKTVIAVDGSYPAAAPSRWLVNSAEEPHQSFDIRIAAKDADDSDRLFVKTATDKADKYIIGQDLAKISVSKKAAQFWVDRYDAQLCVNTQAVDNDQAFFPLGIFAPTNGQYTISSATALANNEELFVTIDGAPVWNLGAGAYTIDLAAGNTTEYGLMVVYHPAPEVTTGCENIEANNNASVRKVLINGQVYILRDGAVYTIFGQKAK